MPSDFEKLTKQVEDLQKQVASMQQVNLITPEFKQVLERSVVTASGKGSDSEAQSVDEAGTGNYTVLSNPDRFIVIGGYHLPAWDN